MYYQDSSGNRYVLGRAFTYNNNFYPKTLATASQFTSLGFTYIVPGAKPDGRFYIVSGPDANGQYTSTDRDLADLKTIWKKETKRLLFLYLSAHNWMAIRKSEVGTDIPSDVVTYRASLRSVSDTRCNQIDAVSSVSALETLITSEEGTSTGLTAWPTLANESSYDSSSY